MMFCSTFIKQQSTNTISLLIAIFCGTLLLTLLLIHSSWDLSALGSSSTSLTAVEKQRLYETYDASYHRKPSPPGDWNATFQFPEKSKPTLMLDWYRLKRDLAIKVLESRNMLPVQDTVSIDPFDALASIPISYTCDKLYFRRIGNDRDIGDGGKWVCGEFLPNSISMSLVSSAPCVVFSIGSNGDFSFESAFMNHVGRGRCKMYTFDCTGDYSSMAPWGVSFHKWCLASRDYKTLEGLEYKSWSSILSALGISKVDYLKMDIESYEWSALPPIFDSIASQLPSQISFEFHEAQIPQLDIPKDLDYKNLNGSRYLSISRLFLKAYKAGYEVAAVERNIICPGCSEFVLVLPKSIGLVY